MGYRVDYLPIKKIRGREKRTSRVAALTGICFVLFCILVSSVWPQGADVLRGIVFPGNAAVTVAALDDFALELKSGEEWSSALEAFCRRVMEESGFDRN